MQQAESHSQHRILFTVLAKHREQGGKHLLLIWTYNYSLLLSSPLPAGPVVVSGGQCVVWPRGGSGIDILWIYFISIIICMDYNCMGLDWTVLY